MATQTLSEISSEIDAHMRSSGIPNSKWYVGITSDIEQRLFGHHKVPRQNHWFIYRRCASADDARSLEAAYHRAGCQGAGGGGDASASVIYAYVITQTTVE
ncbi:MAG: hypothetical protein WAN12_14920 [Candidatus Acidiferrum sp.]